MKVFKFGGASVKDAEGVKNIKRVLEITADENLVVVVSAMGKMTNHLEKMVEFFISNQIAEQRECFDTARLYHFDILDQLFTSNNHPVYARINELFEELSYFLKTNKSKDHAFAYDQIVSYGELFSTTLISEYLNDSEIKNDWLDVRQCIKTDANYRDANIDWEKTQSRISKKVNSKGITITQGFIASEITNNFTTTIGREGSDYTAAIFAYCLNADSVTIWKDVPGVLNADPRHFDKTTLLNHISYREAIELAFYGASVIHPKTLQPLQRKEIPLYVKSFLNPMNEGTCVGKGVKLDPMTSCFILKKDQILISLSSLDFSFIVEEHIANVFKWLSEYQMKVALIQNSAISFSVCVDNKFDRLEELLSKLKSTFNVGCIEGVTLYSIRHSNPTEIKTITGNKEVLLKQESRETVQLVVKEQ